MRTALSILWRALLWMLILYVSAATVVGITALIMRPEQAKDTFFIMLLMGWLMMAISFTPFGEMGYNGKESSEMLRMVFWGWLTAGIILGALHHAWRASRDDLIQTPDQVQDTHL